MAKVRYEADVVGCRAPYEWSLFRIGPSTTQRFHLGKGAADSFAAACFDASEYAQTAESKRRHAATKQVVVVLELDVDPEPVRLDDDVPVAEPDRPHRADTHPDVTQFMD